MKNYYQILLKHFIVFLKRKNAYRIYLECLDNGDFYRKQFREKINAVEFIIYNIRYRPTQLICGAFDWSINRNINWSHLDLEWIQEYKKLAFKYKKRTL